MPDGGRRYAWRRGVVAAAAAALIWSAAQAKDTTASVKEAEQSIAQGNLRAAEIQLRNAIRAAPEDPLLRARLAEVYLQLGDAAAAEREARTARERNGNEADYLPVLAEALLSQEKFADLDELVQPGDRDPIIEGKVRTALGAAAAGLGDQAKAEKLLSEAIELDPTAVRPKIQLAWLLAKSKPASADKLIDEAIGANPRSAEALRIKGEMLRSRGDQEGAMRLFDEALEVDPKNTSAQLSRAAGNIALGKYEAADADINPILKAAPNQFMANYLRGLELAKQEKYADADRILDRISPGFARFWAGYYVQGATKLKLRQYAQAEISLGKYRAHAPDDVKAAQLIATAALEQRAAPRAIAYLKPFADRTPADPATLAILGNAYMADRKPDLALEQFQKIAALDPNNPAIRAQIGISELEAGQREQGLATLQEVFATEAGAPFAGPTLVVTELRARRLDKAAQIAQSLVKRDPKNAVYHTLLGVVRATQGDYSAAESSFGAALAINPDLAVATRDLALVYAATGRADEARNLYKKLLAKDPSDVATLLGLADTYLVQEKWAEAIEAINRARTAARSDPAPGLKLVGVYEMRQDWANAKAVAAELAAQFPGDANILDTQGQAQLAAGDTNDASISFRRAYELAPNSAPIRSRYLAALTGAKHFTEARGVLQQAIVQDPRNSSLKADLIKVESEVDGVDAAVAKARALAAADPESDIYDVASAELYEKAGRTQDAIALLEKAGATRPAAESLTTALAGLYTRSGEIPKAEGLLALRLQANPQSVAVGAALAQLYLATGRAAEAKKLFAGVDAQRPNEMAALLGLAEVATIERNWSEAEDYLNRARNAGPSNPAPGVALVNLELLREDWKKAVTTAERIAAQFPSNTNVLDAKGRAQIASGGSEGAIATYKRIYELSPNSLPAAARYVALLSEARQFSKARAVLQAAFARDPKNGPLKGDLIRVEAEIGGMPAGFEKLRAFAKEDPGNPLYDLLSAELFEKFGHRDWAVDALEKAVSIKPTADDLIVALSGLYVRSGELGKAEEVLNTRLKADPKNLAIRSALASFHAEQKKYDDAIAEYARLIVEHPGNAVALNNLAWLYQQKGDLAKARGLAEQAVAAALRATQRVPQIDDTLGWILLAQGETDKALTYLSAASVLAPKNPNIQYHLAVALNRLGRTADAEAMLKSLLGSGATFSDKTEAEKLLQQLKRG